MSLQRAELPQRPLPVGGSALSAPGGEIFQKEALLSSISKQMNKKFRLFGMVYPAFAVHQTIEYAHRAVVQAY